jgi:hypothetical protein
MGDLDYVGNKLHQSLVTSLCNPGLNYLVSSKVHAILDDISDDSHGLAFNRAQGTARKSWVSATAVEASIVLFETSCWV